MYELYILNPSLKVRKKKRNLLHVVFPNEDPLFKGWDGPLSMFSRSLKYIMNKYFSFFNKSNRAIRYITTETAINFRANFSLTKAMDKDKRVFYQLFLI